MKWQKINFAIYSSPLKTVLIISPRLRKSFLPYFLYLTLDLLRLFRLWKCFPYFLPCLYRVCMRKAAFHFITETIMPTKFCFLRMNRFNLISNFGQLLDNGVKNLAFGFIMMIRLERRRDTNRGFSTAWHCNDTIK